MLVTGGAGFIGSRLVDALLGAGHAVRVLDDLSTGQRENLDSRSQFIKGCVTDLSLVREVSEGVAGIFHLAAIASVDRSNHAWHGTHRVNQTGTISILDAARRLGGVPVVYASSAAVYGNQPLMPIKEDAPPSPQTAYAVDKLGSEMHAKVGAMVHAIPSIGLRLFNVYGPGQDLDSPYSGVINIFAKRIAEGSSMTIQGDGRQTRDFVYVDDVVKHFIAAFEATQTETFPSARIFNVASGQKTSIVELAKALVKISAKKVDIIYRTSRKGDISASIGDPMAARSSLGVSCDIPLLEGLRMLLSGLNQETKNACS